MRLVSYLLPDLTPSTVSFVSMDYLRRRYLVLFLIFLNWIVSPVALSLPFFLKTLDTDSELVYLNYVLHFLS